jgi:hypothetical protein
VLFSREGESWAIAISGGPAPRISQPKPARLEVYHSDQDIRLLAAGYQKVNHVGSGIDADANITDGDATFPLSRSLEPERHGAFSGSEG